MKQEKRECKQMKSERKRRYLDKLYSKQVLGWESDVVVIHRYPSEGPIKHKKSKR